MVVIAELNSKERATSTHNKSVILLHFCYKRNNVERKKQTDFGCLSQYSSWTLAKMQFNTNQDGERQRSWSVVALAAGWSQFIVQSICHFNWRWSQLESGLFITFNRFVPFAQRRTQRPTNDPEKLTFLLCGLSVNNRKAWNVAGNVHSTNTRTRPEDEPSQAGEASLKSIFKAISSRNFFSTRQEYEIQASTPRVSRNAALKESAIVTLRFSDRTFSWMKAFPFPSVQNDGASVWGQNATPSMWCTKQTQRKSGLTMPPHPQCVTCKFRMSPSGDRITSFKAPKNEALQGGDQGSNAKIGVKIRGLCHPATAGPWWLGWIIKKKKKSKAGLTLGGGGGWVGPTLGKMWVYHEFDF